MYNAFLGQNYQAHIFYLNNNNKKHCYAFFITLNIIQFSISEITNCFLLSYFVQKSWIISLQFPHAYNLELVTYTKYCRYLWIWYTMQNTLLDSLHYFRMDSYKCKSILRNRVPRIKVCEYNKRYRIYRYII